MYKKLSLLLISLGLTLSSISQITFDQELSNISGLQDLTDGSVEFADIDGDNDEDLLLTGYNTSFSLNASLYKNNGAGQFTLVTGTPFVGVRFSSTAFVDIDGDNDLDVFIIGKSGNIGKERTSFNLYENDGAGNFSTIAHPFELLESASFAFADIDGDADQDILISGNSGKSNKTNLYKNDGLGNFSLVSGTSFQAVARGSVTFGDIDGDNDKDIMILGDNKATILYTNDGSGTFTPMPNTPFETLDDNVTSTLDDIDNDGDLDLLITGANASNVYVSLLYINDGSGNFSLKNGTPFQQVPNGDVAFIDVDNDGDKDLLMTGQPTSANLYENDGTNNFTLVTSTSFTPIFSSAIDITDIDGDNDKDLIITGSDFNYNKVTAVYKNTTVTCSLINQNINSFTTSICLGGGIKAELENSELGAKYAIYNAANTRVSEFISGNGAVLSLYSSDSISVSGTYYIQAEDESKSSCQQVIGDIQNVKITSETELVETQIISCSSVEWRGKVYNQSGEYKEKVISEEGCKTLYRLKLIIIPIDASIKLEGNTLAGETSFGTYQWLNCDNNYESIEGATLRKFTPTESGNYALQIAKNGCIDTSACIQVTITDINEALEVNNIQLYPNPTTQNINLSFDNEQAEITISVKDLVGRLINKHTFYNKENVNLSLEQPKGIYLVHLSTQSGIEKNWRVVKQ